MIKKNNSFLRFDPTAVNEQLKVTAGKVVPTSRLYRHKQRKNKGKNGQLKINAPLHILEDLSKKIAANVNDMEAMVEVLPEMERAMGILESAILSPQDLLEPKLTYRLPDDFAFKEVGNAFISLVSAYIKNNTTLEKDLPTILREALHTKGSHVIAVLPESSIDEIINSHERITLESYSIEKDTKSIGILGDPDTDTTLSMEALNIPTAKVKKTAFTGIEVYDDYSILKYPEIEAKLSRIGITESIFGTLSTESRSIKDPALAASEAAASAVLAQRLRSRRYAPESAVEVNARGRRDNKARPVIMNLPSESVIPVHVTGNPSNQLGFFVLLDERGRPIQTTGLASHYESLRRSNVITDTNGATSQLLKEINARTKASISNDVNAKDLLDSFTHIVERDLVSRLKNGIIGDEASIATNDIVFRMMFARALEAKQTKVLFLPSDLVTYFAFEYDKNGIGKSRLEKSKVLASLRATLLYANMEASVRNSQGEVSLNIELDETDPDPDETINDIVDEFITRRYDRAALGSSLDLADISKTVRSAGITVSASGNESYPGTKVNIEDTSRSVVNIDTTLDEDLRKRIFMMMGLSPEMVDSSFDVEFATSLVNNSLILAKIATQLQGTFLPSVTGHTRKVSLADPILLKSIYDAIKDNKELKGTDVVDVIYEMFELFEAYLPMAETAKFESQMEAYTAYKDAVDLALEAYINPDMMEGFSDSDVEDAIGPFTEAMRAYLLRTWLMRENILPELNVIGGKDSVDISEIHNDHMNGMFKDMGKFLSRYRKYGRVWQHKEDKKIEKDEERFDSGKEIDDEGNTVADDPVENTDDTTTDDTTDESTPAQDDAGQGDDGIDDLPTV